MTSVAARSRYRRKLYAIDPVFQTKVKVRSREAIERKREYVRQRKDVPCADCGRRYPYYVMDFDHVRGEKLFNLSRAVQQSWDRVVAELDKCDVVCANCHRIRTQTQRGVKAA